MPYIPEGLSIEDWHDFPRSMRNAITRKHERETSISRDRGHVGCDDCEFARSTSAPIRDWRDLPFMPIRRLS